MSRDETEDELFLRYSRPGRKFLVGDAISVSIFNPAELPIEVILIFRDGSRVLERVKYVWDRNPLIIRPSKDKLGTFQLVARSLVPEKLKRSNSISGEILKKTECNADAVQRDRICEHKQDCAVGSNARGVLTLTNPWITPGNFHPEHGDKWFPTEVYEGATSLYNEVSRYYEDPEKYFIENIRVLKKKGFNFVTWHDVLNKPNDDLSSSVLIQFDIDAGARSFMQISKQLLCLGVRASVMVNWTANHWFSYEFKSDDIQSYQNLERAGWAVGYHNNTLTILSALDPDTAKNGWVIEEAKCAIRDHVEKLREHLNIKTVTHHGGNVENNKVPIPSELNIIPVDRYLNGELWKQVVSTFSDGSFTARPCPMSEWVTEQRAGNGLVFMRCHPVKYGNYNDALDLAPLVSNGSLFPGYSEARKRLLSGEPRPLDRQTVWLNLRDKGRLGTKLYESSSSRPISANFFESERLSELIEKFRANRSANFLRQYPWPDGDPRVLWWKITSTFCPTGQILNVGAMPPGQKDQNTAFIPGDAILTELDIDPKRHPDILADFCDPDFSVSGEYDAILLNGLPYFSDPSVAVSNALKLTRAGGKLIIGAAGASQPERGGFFRPKDRPIWREGNKIEQGVSLSLDTLLWSFDQTSICHLMKNWKGSYIAESISHYWFVVADKAIK